MPQRRAWNQQQDNILRKLKQQRKQSKWSTIARIMQTEYQIIGRSGKQCRQRYYNFIDSSINRNEWTVQEEKMLFDLHNQYGNKWALISKKITGRSDNCVKNHFYSKLRKALRRINKIIQIRLKKQYKQIKSSVIYQILQISQSKFKISSRINQDEETFCSELVNRLFQFDIQNSLLTANDEMEAEKIYKDIVQFEKGCKKNKKRFLLQPTDDFHLHPKSCLKIRRSSSHQSNNSEYDSNSQNSDMFSSESANFLDSSFDSSSFISSVSHSSEIKIKVDWQQQNSTMIKDSQTTKKSETNQNQTGTNHMNFLQISGGNYLHLSIKSARSDQNYPKSFSYEMKSQNNSNMQSQNQLYQSQQKIEKIQNIQKNYINQHLKSNFYENQNIITCVQLSNNNIPSQQQMQQQFCFEQQHQGSQKCAFFEDIKIEMRIISPKMSSNSSISFGSNKDFEL